MFDQHTKYFENMNEIGLQFHQSNGHADSARFTLCPPITWWLLMLHATAWLTISRLVGGPVDL